MSLVVRSQQLLINDEMHWLRDQLSDKELLDVSKSEEQTDVRIGVFD